MTKNKNKKWLVMVITFLLFVMVLLSMGTALACYTPTPTEETPTETVTPTEEPVETPQPKGEKEKPEEEDFDKPTETPPPPCLEQDVKTEIRGGSTVFRIWVNSEGVLYNELDLLRDFQGFNFVQSQSIDYLSGCWVYFTAERYDYGLDLYKISSDGSELHRLTDTEASELDVFSTSEGKLIFTQDEAVVQSNLWGKEIDQVGVTGRQPQKSPDSSRITFVPTEGGLSVLDQSTAKYSSVIEDAINYAWNRDGASIFYSAFVTGNGNYIYELDFESGVSTLFKAGEDTAPDPRYVQQNQIIERDGQLYWIWLNEKSRSDVQITNDGLTHTHPDWWNVELLTKPSVNMKSYLAFEKTLGDEGAGVVETTSTADSTSAEASQVTTEFQEYSESQTEIVLPACQNYEGDSIVQCLDAAGFPSNLFSRGQLAVVLGLMDDAAEFSGTPKQNTDLLESVRGGAGVFFVILP